MKKYKYSILLLFIITQNIFTQNNTFFDVTKVVPNSPNAASLGIYGEIPIGLYTGSPNITIPIYEIDLDGKKIPISLSYHASGIKVNQEASWVGLGWSLNAGGTITKEIRGWDDFLNNPLGSYYQQNIFPTATGENDMNPETFLLDYDKYMAFLNNLRDPEPDIFYYNFCNFSGSMVFERDNSNYEPFAKTRKNENYIKAKYNIAGKFWSIFDGDGFEYQFNSNETTYNYSKTDGSKNHLNRVEIPFSNLQPEVITSWVLTQIISPFGNAVSFTYQDESIFTVQSISEYTVYGQDPNSTPINTSHIPSVSKNYTHSYSRINQKILKSINYNQGQITFNTSSRKDIEATTPNTFPSKLDEIIVLNSNEIIKKVQFKYIYNNEENNYLKCRLVLDSIKEDEGKNHSFTYFAGSLPEKNSGECDYWGYYNGKPASTQTDFLLSPTTYVSNGQYHDIFTGKDLTPNNNLSQIGILKSIKYPTGGITRLNYSLHKFNNGFRNSLSYENIKDISDFWNDGNLTTTSEPFEIQQPGTYKFKVSYFETGYIDTTENQIPEIIPEIKINAFVINTNQTGSPTCSIYDFVCDKLADSIIALPKIESGSYRIVLTKNHEDSNNSKIINAKVQLLKINFPICNEGSGLKIDSINYFDNQNILLQTKKYSYNIDGNSSGKIMFPPKQVYNGDFYGYDTEQSIDTTEISSNTTTVGNNNTAQIGGYVYAVSSSITPFSGSANGFNVGYSFVEETVYDYLTHTNVISALYQELTSACCKYETNKKSI